MQNFSKKNTILILAGVLVLFFIVSLFFILRQRTSQETTKKVFNPIPKEAEFAKDQLIVQFFNPYVMGENKKLDKKLKEIGVISMEKLYKDTKDPVLERFYIVNFKKDTDIRQVHKVIFELKDVESTDPNYVMKAFEAPNDQYYSQMWGLKKIDAENAWTATKGSTNITVAVVDTGIDYNHPDLPKENILKGRDFINGDDDAIDDHGHGTHVAGTIGALTNNGTGVAGINWNVKLMAVKVLGADGSSHGSEVVQGIAYAADNGAKVINMSLGGYAPCGSSYQSVIDSARSKGVVVVVAAGNGNPPGFAVDASTSNPANCRGVIVVGATDPTDTRASFSNFGSIVSIAAPGKNILSTTKGAYASWNGTSMATPHVAGSAALLLSAKPDLTPDQVKDCLVRNADSIQTDRPIGPRLNIYKAINNCAGGGGPPPPASSVTPPGGSVTPTQKLSITPSVRPSISPIPKVSPTPVIGSFMIHGHVYNRIRRGVSGKIVLFHETAAFPGLSGSEISNKDGYYSLPELDEGIYKLSLVLDGKTYEYPTRKVALNKSFPVAIVNFIIDDFGKPPVIEIINAPIITTTVSPVPKNTITTAPSKTPTTSPKPSPTSGIRHVRATITPFEDGEEEPTPTPVPYRCQADLDCINKNPKTINMCPLKCTPI